MTTPVIEIHGVSKSFQIPKVRRETIREHLFHLMRSSSMELLCVLKSIDFEVASGDCVGIMGRNGAGKSTLLKILCGIYGADTGSIVVRAPMTPILELGIGWNPELDAVDNILLVATVMGMSLKEAKRSVDEVLAFAELERFARLELKHYSSGMSSRLAYATAFAAVNEVLIIDEVLAVGDAAFKEKCLARARDLARAGHTLLLVGHDPTTMASVCRRILLLEKGEIVKDGPPNDVICAYLDLMHRKGTIQSE